MLGKIRQIFILKNYKRFFSYIHENGFKGLFGKIRAGFNAIPLDEHYNEWFYKNAATEEVLVAQKSHVFEYKPLISLLVPTFNTPKDMLCEMVDSVRAQSYDRWELCIADGSSLEETRETLESYVKMDERIKVVYLDQNYGISGNTNKALEVATGDFIGLIDHDDTVEPDMLYEVVSKLQDSSVDMVYTDEDKMTTRRLDKNYFHLNPIFKPDYSPDLLRSHNYITHFLVIRSSIVNEVGGFDSEFDGAQDYNLILNCVEVIHKRGGKIEHVPRILYHWRMTKGSTAENPESKMYAYESGRKAIETHLHRLGIDATVEMTDMWGLYHPIYKTVGNPLLSIIIPNKDHIDDLDKCIRSLEIVNTYKNIEIIVVENNSESQETFDYYDKLQTEFGNVKVVKWEKEFNYSAINNFGAKHAKGEYFLLLNNDTEVISPNGISDMLGILLRDDVGIVGAKLLYADDTIQHAGIVLGFQHYAGHVFHTLPKDDYGYMMRPRINCNYSAVTGACLMVKKSVFDEVKGLSEDFPVAGNDVDFCLKVRDKGYLVVYDAFALFHHYESKSRGYEDTPEKKARFRNEILMFQDRWKDILENGDPYYNPNLTLDRQDYSLR